jgi:HlyD family type I secretion membrane fusion protein
MAMAMAALGFIAWASIAPLSGAVVAVGLAKAETSRKAVQHTEGGIVKALLVRDGDQVKAGQALIELENITADANHQLLMELIVYEMLRRDRLDAEQQLATGFTPTSERYGRFASRLVSQAMQREMKIFQTKRTGLDQQIATLEEQLGAIDAETRALTAEVQADRQALRLAEDELSINRSLEKSQFVSKTRLIGLERGLADYQSRLGEHEAELEQSRQRKNEVKLRMAASRNEYQRAAAEEYKESSARLAELRERLRPIEDAMQRKVIVAQVSGHVVGLKLHASGEVAGPRDVLMEIVPDQDELILEAPVSVDAIKDLHIGQHADIKFTAYKSRTTPIVKGKVTYVSPDALIDKNGAPHYLVHVEPDIESMKSAGLATMQPGMAAELFIVTEGRSTLDYLLAPIVDTMRHALREK